MKRVSESAQLLAPEQSIKVIPDIATALVLGANVIRDYGDGDGVKVSLGKNSWMLSEQDYDQSKGLADVLEKQLSIGRVCDGSDVLNIRRHAQELMSKPSVGEPSVVMLKDKGSSGWWRMVLPMRYFQSEKWHFDCTASQVDFDNLLEYDTIFVQRIHDWESYYMLARLQRAGKRIVYDIDDDIFNITPDNPAYNTITRDDQVAGSKCMKLADALTVSTPELKRRIENVVDGVEPIVIPNSWDVDDNWIPTPMTGSPDGYKRILWSGGASHAEDWNECFHAVVSIMSENPDVKLVILGYLPPCIEQNATQYPFKGRVEYLGFRHPETYYELLHHLHAEVGLAPVRETNFNACKSSIKYLEYTCTGIPIVASGYLPYSGDIVDGQNGFLVRSQEEWERAMQDMLDDKKRRHSVIANARKQCKSNYDIKKNVKMWEEVLCGC